MLKYTGGLAAATILEPNETILVLFKNMILYTIVLAYIIIITLERWQRNGRERLWARSGAIILLSLIYCIRERGPWGLRR